MEKVVKSTMPMNSETDIPAEMRERAKRAILSDDSIVPGIERMNIDSIEQYGDFEYIAEEKYVYKNEKTSTVSDFLCAVAKLEEFVEESDIVDCRAEDIGEREAKEFKKWLLSDKGGVGDQTAQAYIRHLSNMADFYVSKGYYEGNPLADINIDVDYSRDQSSSFQSNERIVVDDNKLRKAIRSAHGSQVIVLLAVLLKTGIRVSECCNLDWEDINIDHKLADDLLPDPRYELSEIPDAIYVDCNKTESTYKSESGGNKRKVSSYIPIDDELKRLLIWHALVHEQRFDDENPVFITENKPTMGRKTTDRLTTATAWRKVRDWAIEQDNGWYEAGRGEKQNVTPHWFRAKFTTYMSQRLENADDINADPKDIVKGLRGDVGSDIIEDYRFRDNFSLSAVRPRQFKIGLEGI